MTRSKPYNETELFARLANGDENAFSIVFNRYYDWFYGRAFKLSASHYFSEELVQETFVQLWNQRQYLAAAKDPDAYLFKMFYRELHARLRREALEKRRRNAVLDMPMDEDVTQDDMKSLERNIAVFKAALREMPPQQLAVFRLIKEEGMSRQEVAERLGISPNTVRNHLAEAMRRLREIARTIALWILPF